ncbi:hypothetical protein [Streptomyces sp. NPDC002553]|uniref:hypothetical protein n=1 Tax=Streptomyces sp. NPDC002553 TaxID=3154417 RepID=UPI00332126B1
MQPANSPDENLRSLTEGIARRVADEKRPAHALRSVVSMIDNDEAELAVDDLARAIEYYRVPILRAEYDQLLEVATRLDSLDSLRETDIAQFVRE